MKTAFSFFALLIFSALVIAQPTYVQRMGSTDSDFGLACSPTLDNGVILVMESATNGLDLHAALLKTDANGFLQWHSNYRIGDFTVPSSVLQTKDEGYIILAYATDSSYINNNKNFIVLYKTNLSGQVLWNKQYSFSDNDISLNLVHRNAGGYISFSKGDYNLGTYPKTIVSAYRDDGTILWTRQFTAQYGLNGVKGIEMADSNICFIATAPDPSNYFFTNVIVTLLDRNGNLLWSKNIGTYYDDEPFALGTNSSKEIFITGRSYFINRNWDSFFLKLNNSGNLLQSRVFDGGSSSGEIMRCILVNSDGTCHLLGDMGTFDERDITLLNLDTSGSAVSAKRYAFSPLFTNYPYDLFRAADGGLIFTGDYRPPTAYRDAILVKTESDGNLNCFMSPAAINEYPENFYDSLFIVSSNTSPATQLTFQDTVPPHPFSDHLVCALSTAIDYPVKKSSLLNYPYPNPFTSELSFFSSSNQQAEHFRLIAPDGKVFFPDYTIADSGVYTINSGTLPPGLYIFECRYSDGLEHYLVVKK